MPFYTTGDQQVRLRFSRYTEEVIKNDMFLFGETKENTFINKVIINFYQDANASIHFRLEELRQSLAESIPSGISTDSADALLNALTSVEEQRLLSLAASYETPDKNCKSKPYRLQNVIYSELTDEHSDFQENIYYNESLASYIKTLMEEYAHQSYIRREQIYFKEVFDTINEAITSKKQLLITVSNGNSYHTLPYKILSDPLSTTSYLTGYSYGLHADKGQKYTVSYKIAAIRKMKLEKSKSGYLHPDDVSFLLKDIAEKGVQFLVSEYTEIKVRFTEDGMRSFERWLHLRPAPVHTAKEDDCYILTFHCSIVQAKAYFFKFGATAEILSPASLRQEFAEQYKHAFSQYL